MSILLRLVSAIALSFAIVAPTAAGPMTTGDRQRLVAHLEMTEAWLVDEVDGLSDAQLKYRMAPGTWSVMDAVEHLAIAEPQYWKNLQDSLARPVQPGFKSKGTDAGILWYGIDRTQRATTGDARVPHGTFPSVKESLASFRQLRATMLEAARTSPDDFRGRPLLQSEGTQDVYQWFLMISAHAQRHILQIREVKAHAGFPKS